MPNFLLIFSALMLLRFFSLTLLACFFFSYYYFSSRCFWCPTSLNYIIQFLPISQFFRRYDNYTLTWSPQAMSWRMTHAKQAWSLYCEVSLQLRMRKICSHFGSRVEPNRNLYSYYCWLLILYALEVLISYYLRICQWTSSNSKRWK